MPSRRKKADADCVYNSVETLKLASSAAVTRMALTALCKHPRFPVALKVHLPFRSIKRITSR